MDERKTVLSVSHLCVTFTQYGKGLKQVELPVIRDLSLRIHEKELVAVVGSSGSGKSLLAHAVLGLLPYNGRCTGDIIYKGEPLTDGRLKKLRGHEIVLVPQSVSYLDPLMKAGPLVWKGSHDPGNQKKGREALKRYGLGEEAEKLYPFELSGGMTRRVLIASAVMENPGLVIADEPTPGLHIEAARRVLSHFREMADEGAGVLLITHDLELAMECADRIVVFYAGMDMEDAAAGDFREESSLRHPYTRALYRAMPQHGFESTDGIQPYVKDMPEGCPYGPRCPYAEKTCRELVESHMVRGGMVRCCQAT